MQVSRVLRNWADSDGERSGFTHWCPGCEHSHEYVTYRKDGKHDNEHPVWGFNGNVECPTFTPSMRIFIHAHEDDGVKFAEQTTCHYFLTDGQIRFCGDCQHKLNGQTVPLPDLPSEADYHYGDMPQVDD